MISEYKIVISGLKNGLTEHRYRLDHTFFNSFDTDLFNDCDILVDLMLKKGTTQVELKFDVSGTITLPCDLSGRLFPCPVNNSHNLVIKFSDEMISDAGDDLIYIPHGNQIIHLEQIIYDIVYLSVPGKRIHPEEKQSEEDVDFFYTTSINTEKNLSSIKEKLVQY